MVQEQAITAVASIADSAEEAFVRVRTCVSLFVRLFCVSVGPTITSQDSLLRFLEGAATGLELSQSILYPSLCISSALCLVSA